MVPGSNGHEMNPPRLVFWAVCALAFGFLNSTLHAQDLLRISEFAAVNRRSAVG